MELGKKFNQLTFNAYQKIIPNHKKYSDFNTLGLYRSICENEKLDTHQKIEIRDFANRYFGKTYRFLQLKDPTTYIKLMTLGKKLTNGDEYQIWDDIRINQQKILAEKKIQHRSIGNYSKHNCGFEDCPMNGIMVRAGSWLAENHMSFDTDFSKYSREEKAKRIKKERKSMHQIIRKELENNLDR